MTAIASPAARPRRLLLIVGWTLIWLGVFVFGYISYQLWGTGLVTSSAQVELERQFDARLATEAPPAETPAPASNPQRDLDQPPPVEVSLTSEASPEVGGAVGRILIPSANVEAMIVEGVDPKTLKKGPGHMPRTPLPGQPGNAVISGHRTTYGAPFFDLDLLVPGDLITVETGIGQHLYKVRESIVVDPTDVWVTNPRPGAWLTLTTCTPRYSAAKRLIIFAELVSGPNYEATYDESGVPLEPFG